MSAIALGGLVLCGGQSRHMGRAKASLPFGGETMLGRVVRLIGEVARPLVVVAAPEQLLPPLPDAVEVCRDEIPGEGPLHGLARGLNALKGRADAAFVSSCDVPFLKPELIRRLASLLGDAAICVPRVGEYHHPLAAIYRVEVAETAQALLAQKRLRPFYLFEALPTRIVTASELADVDPEFRSLRNLNCPEEYEAALRELESK